MLPSSTAEVLDVPQNIVEPSEIRGRFILRISDDSGDTDFSVPDPEQLSGSMSLSASQLHVLNFIRENVKSVPERRSGHAAEASGCDSANECDSNQHGVEESSSVPVGPRPVYSLGGEMNASTVVKFLEDISRTIELDQINPRRLYRFHDRERKIHRAPSNLRKKRLERALRAGNPFQNRPWKCCSRYQCFKRVGADRCYDEYKAVNSMTPQQAKRHLVGMYDQCENVFRMGGEKLCSRFLAKCLGFSNDVQCAIKNTPKARGSAIARPRAREVKRKTKRVFIVSFIKRLAQMFGDAMPNRDHITLPILNRKALWKECEDAWKNSGRHGGDLKVSQNYFYRVWRTFAAFVNVRKNHGFTVCSICEMLREEMSKHLQDEDTLVKLIEQHAAHLKFIERERNGYEARQNLAEQNPDRYCSIIVDGADQKKYGLPHFAISTKSEAGHKLKVKVVGVLEHILRGKEWLSLFAMTEEYETGANHIVEVVHQTLQRKKNKLGRLPPVLFVQVDNCIRENKNRYFMSYFQSLVHLGVFNMVQISFLPIGHTHADIDQTFSSISKHLTINDAITLPEMLEELEKCYARRITASQLTSVINYSGLCEKTGCLNDVEPFSQYRYFRFLRKESDSVESVAGLHGSSCDVKIQDADAWAPFPNSHAEGFLKFVPSFGQTPATVTKELFNEMEVTKCLSAAEERVKDDSKMTLLRDLKAKVYHVREEPFHWIYRSCFEHNGDYAVSAGGDIEINNASQVENVLRRNYGYDPDDFVAVATNTDPTTGFWIGRVKGVSELDSNERAKTITIRWYVASGSDPYEGKYTPAWRTVDGVKAVYEDEIDAASVLVRFENLTTARRLRARDKKAIKQTLNEN